MAQNLSSCLYYATAKKVESTMLVLVQTLPLNSLSKSLELCEPHFLYLLTILKAIIQTFLPLPGWLLVSREITYEKCLVTVQTMKECKDISYFLH